MSAVDAVAKGGVEWGGGCSSRKRRAQIMRETLGRGLGDVMRGEGRGEGRETTRRKRTMSEMTKGRRPQCEEQEDLGQGKSWQKGGIQEQGRLESEEGGMREEGLALSALSVSCSCRSH